MHFPVTIRDGRADWKALTGWPWRAVEMKLPAVERVGCAGSRKLIKPRVFLQCREAFVCSLSYVWNTFVWRKSDSSQRAVGSRGGNCSTSICPTELEGSPPLVKHRGTRRGGAMTHLCTPLGRCTKPCVAAACKASKLLPPLLLRFRGTCGVLKWAHKRQRWDLLQVSLVLWHLSTECGVPVVCLHKL